MIKKRCPKCERYYVPETGVCPRDGTRLSTVLIEALDGRTLLNRYKLDEEIGRGGMGIVYRGKQLTLNRPVAIKFLIQNLTDEISGLARFRQEAKAASSLNHPGIIRVIDFDVSEEGLPFLVMELLEGQTLSDVVAGAVGQANPAGSIGLTTEKACSIIIQIADALTHAHSHNVVHRDIKTSNIMLVTRDGGIERPVLLDFSIAKLFAQAGSAKQHLTKSGEVFGSPLYMSPEQCMGQASDYRSDIYSLACVAYELLSGKPPFVGDNVLQTIYKHINEEPRSFNEVCPDRQIPAKLGRAIMKALKKSPEQRYQSISEFKQNLEAAEVLMRTGSSGVEEDSEGDIGQFATETSFEFYRVGAEQGDAFRQFDLGCCYFYGDGVKKDLDLAAYWFLNAAKQGDPLAQNQVGHMCYYGWGHERDYEQAVQWYRKAAEGGVERAQYNLGWCYELGHGVDVDYDLAAYWYRKSAEQDNLEAQNQLAGLYKEGLGVEQNTEESLHWYRRAARHGDANAWAKIFELETDKGKRQEAFDMLLELAETGAGQAQFELGMLFRYGVGVEEDLAAAKLWIERAAEAGVGTAQLDIAKAYQYGYYGKCDFQKAWHWLKKCAEDDIAGGAYGLALLYENGDGVPQDEQTAVNWLRKAAEGGSRDAQYLLSFSYRLGRGVKQNLAKAEEWLQRSAIEDKHPPAMFVAGLALVENGKRKALRQQGKLLIDQALLSPLFQVPQELLADIEQLMGTKGSGKSGARTVGGPAAKGSTAKKSTAKTGTGETGPSHSKKGASPGNEASADKSYEAGQRVDVQWGDDSYAAVILYKSRTGRLLVHYLGWETEHDEWITSDRIIR